MRLCKAITLTAAAAAALLALTPAVQATNPTGANISNISVNGVSTTGTDAVDGSLASGTLTFVVLGFIASCSPGTVGGVVNRGPSSSGAAAFTLNNLSLTCGHPLGLTTNIALDTSNPLCVANVSMGGVRTPNDNVHTGLSDTAFWTGPTSTQKFHNVVGTLTLPPAAYQCFRVTVYPNCTVYIQGTVQAQFNETIRTVGGVSYQDLVLNGGGLSFYTQTGGCLNLMSGAITLNQIDFKLRVTAGTTTGIDFQ
jgi:hypothetical protein